MSIIGDLWYSFQTSLSRDYSRLEIVSSAGHTAFLTIFICAAMAFLIVFVLILGLATERLSQRWSDELAHTLTVRISSPPQHMQNDVSAALEILETTPGILRTRVIPLDEQKELLKPWFGINLPLEILPIPSLIEIVEQENITLDIEGLRLRLQAQISQVALDDHSRWRNILISAALRLRLLSLFAMILIGVSISSMIIMATQAALAANEQIIMVLRLVGAQDNYIVKSFVYRFALRGFFGALIGMLLAILLSLLLTRATEEGIFLSGLGFQGIDWILPLSIPFIIAILAWFACAITTRRVLARTP